MSEAPSLWQRLRQRLRRRRSPGEDPWDPDEALPVQSLVELALERVRQGLKVLLLIVLFVCLFWFEHIFIFVNSGEAGVRWHRLWGGTELHTYGEGLHVIWPWDRMYLYEVRIQSLALDSTIYSQDGLEIRVRANVRFHPAYETLGELHQDVGPEYVKRLVAPEILSTLRKVLGNFTPNDIYSKDEQGLIDELQATMARDFNNQYVVLDKFLIEELKLPENIQKAIQDKLEEEQKVQAYYFILDREEYEHKRRIIEATGIRDFEEISGLPILRWRGLDVTEKLATSNNAKVIIMGSGADQLPLILNTDGNTPLAPQPQKATNETAAPRTPGGASVSPQLQPPGPLKGKASDGKAGATIPRRVEAP